MKRSAHNAEIGFNSLRWKLILNTYVPHISQPAVFLRQRVHRDKDYEKIEIMIPLPVLPTLISHLERALTELQEAHRNLMKPADDAPSGEAAAS